MSNAPFSALDKLGVTPNVRLEIDAMHTTLRLIEGGLACTVLSYSCVHPKAGRGRASPGTSIASVISAVSSNLVFDTVFELTTKRSNRHARPVIRSAASPNRTQAR